MPTLAACGGSTVDPGGATATWPSSAKLLLNSVDLELLEGESFRLETTIVDESGSVLLRPGEKSEDAGQPRLLWSSSDPSVATVDGTGLVSAAGAGNTVISVASGSLASTLQTTVVARDVAEKGASGGADLPEPVSVTLTPDTARITAIGGSMRLTARVHDAAGEEILPATVTWASATPEIASVDGEGNVVSRVAGLALIVATSGSAADTAEIRVDPMVSNVVLSPGTLSLEVGDTVRLMASGVDEMGNTVEGASFSWSSTNAGVASVSSNGIVKAVKGGQVNITATAPRATAKAAASITIEGQAAPVNAASTDIFPGDDIQEKAKSHGAGTVFTIKPGVHRMQRVQPRDGQQFIGEPGAILNGAKRLTSFTRQGNQWVASGQSAVSEPHGRCDSGFPRCTYPEDLFINDKVLHHVDSRSAVGPGRWYFDYGTGRVYIGDDPTGKKVELGATSMAFGGSARNVVIRGLVIEKYASRAQAGAIHGNESRDWVIENNVIRLNHGLGVRVGHGMKVLNNKVLRQGHLGVGGIGDNILVEGNEIAWNNTAGYRWKWEAGGTKFTKTHDLVVRNNHVHHNNGPGLWTDINNTRTLYEDNLVEDNNGPGIFHEISYEAIIRNNTVRRNALGITNSYSGAAGILVSASGCASKPPRNTPVRTGNDGKRVCVEVYGNRVEGNAGAIAAIQQSRGSGVYGEYRLRGVYIHNNYVQWDEGFVAIGGDDGRNDIWKPESNNRFDRNTYRTSGTAKRFHFETGRSFAQWQEAGQDARGKVE